MFFFFKKYLNLSSAENRLAQNRAVRWQDQNTMSLKYTLGPEKSTNLSTCEHLDRPVIKHFQKHPGNQLSEAQEIVKVCAYNFIYIKAPRNLMLNYPNYYHEQKQNTEILEKSIDKSDKHIKTLRVIGRKLDASARDKEFQHSIDSALLRRRREMSDHRWVPEKYVKY